jgi:hypothetical protein
MLGAIAEELMSTLMYVRAGAQDASEASEKRGRRNEREEGCGNEAGAKAGATAATRAKENSLRVHAYPHHRLHTGTASRRGLLSEQPYPRRTWSATAWSSRTTSARAGQASHTRC